MFSMNASLSTALEHDALRRGAQLASRIISSHNLGFGFRSA